MTAQSITAPVATTPLVTDRQIAFAQRLVNERITDPLLREQTMDSVTGGTRKAASEIIDSLLQIPVPAAKPAKGRGKAAATPDVVTEEGFYVNDGRIYKVRAGKSSGRLYAMVLEVIESPETNRKGRWAYANGAIFGLTAAMKITQAQAIAFGHDYGFCFRCGVLLDDPRSVKAGAGKDCAAKMGWKY